MDDFKVGDKVRAAEVIENVDGRDVPAGTVGVVTGDIETGNGFENMIGVEFEGGFHTAGFPMPCWMREIEAVGQK